MELQHVNRLLPNGAKYFLGDAAWSTLGYKAMGSDFGSAVLKGVATAAAGALVGPVDDILQAGVIVGGALTLADTVGRGMYYGNMNKHYNPYRVGGGYVDTQRALTMRQQAVQQLQQSRVNGNLILGNEASFFHK